MALWLYGSMALWLYSSKKPLEKYFYCIETSINATFPDRRKSPNENLFCTAKFCREKLFAYICEWKFIALSGSSLNKLLQIIDFNFFGERN